MSNSLPQEIEIIEESQQWMVVNKPAGLPVHKTSMDEPDLLGLLSPEGRGLHAVHRLDRETSGIVFIAKKKEVAAEIMQIWGSEAVEKKYLAIVHGQLPESMIWKWSLSDRAEGHANPAGPKNLWKNCETRIEIQETTSRASLLQATLITGRKHQIRRHAALAGHPLVGEPRYSKKSPAWPLALHAQSLGLRWRGLNLSWKCKAPAWFTEALKTEIL